MGWEIFLQEFLRRDGIGLSRIQNLLPGQAPFADETSSHISRKLRLRDFRKLESIDSHHFPSIDRPHPTTMMK